MPGVVASRCRFRHGGRRQCVRQSVRSRRRRCRARRVGWASPGVDRSRTLTAMDLRTIPGPEARQARRFI